MKNTLKIRKEKVGKNDTIYDFVAVVNERGNIITCATFNCEEDANTTVDMLEKLLHRKLYPEIKYEDMRNTVDSFFKKLADGKDPYVFDEKYDGDLLFKFDDKDQPFKFDDESTE